MVGQFESNKDTVQVLTESAATHIGNIATIVTGAVRDIAKETGEWLTDVIEMREASMKAKEDAERDDGWDTEQGFEPVPEAEIVPDADIVPDPAPGAGQGFPRPAEPPA